VTNQSMSSPHTDQHIAAAIAVWEPLAAFAWGQFISNGRGVVLLEQSSLSAAAEKARQGESIAIDELDPGYVCARDVPPSDDFAPIIAEYDPNRQIALLVRPERGDERLYILETSELHQRPTPRECFDSLRKRDGST